MLSDALKFWESIAGKVKQLIRGETQNAFRCERYEVSTAPNGTVMGVKKPYGNEILLPYSQEVSEASVGDPVLVVWWNSMSNAKVYYFANGYEGTTGGGGGSSTTPVASISFPLSWTDSGSGYYTCTPTITGISVLASSKVSLQPTEAQLRQLRADGVGNLSVDNVGGVLTAYAIGAAPTTAMTMQCTVDDTTATSGVLGDTVGVGSSPHWEYDTSHHAEIEGNGWTAPYDGIAIARCGWNTSGNAAYYYISDTTLGMYVAHLSTRYANGFSLTTAFPIMKGHVYKKTGSSNISGTAVWCFKLL